jgi:3-oxoacyl-[acyl-carrier-protein] synthase III
MFYCMAVNSSGRFNNFLIPSPPSETSLPKEHVIMSHRKPQAYLSAVAYRVGALRPIETLLDAEASADGLGPYGDRGHKFFSSFQEPLATALTASVHETLLAASASAQNVAAVTIAHTMTKAEPGHEKMALDAFNLLRFDTPNIVELHGQNCSALAAAIDVTLALLDGSQQGLIILGGCVLADKNRFAPNAETIYGDGIATCTISRMQGDFEILGSHRCFNPTLSTDSKNSLSPGEAMLLTFETLQNAVQEAYKDSNTDPRSIDMLLGTNGSTIYLDMMREAAMVSEKATYRQDLPSYGHIFSCDNLISLKNLCADSTVPAGFKILVIGWSTDMVSAVVLQKT